MNFLLFSANEQLANSPSTHISSTFNNNNQNLTRQISSTSTSNNYSQHQSRLSSLFSTKSRYASDTIQQNSSDKQQQQIPDLNNDTLLYASPARSANTTNFHQQQQKQPPNNVSHLQSHHQNSIFTTSNLSPNLTVPLTSNSRLAKSASTSSVTKFGNISDGGSTHAHHPYKSTTSGEGRVLFSRSTSDLNVAGAIHDKNVKRLVDNLTDKDVTINRSVIRSIYDLFIKFIFFIICV